MFFFDKIKSLFHEPIYRLQTLEHGRIVPSQKNSGYRSCTLTSNKIANNGSMSCCKTMIHLKFKPLPGCLAYRTWKGYDGQVGNSGYILHALRRLGQNLFYQILSQGFLKMADDQTGSVLSQSVAVDEQFLFIGRYQSIPIN